VDSGTWSISDSASTCFTTINGSLAHILRSGRFDRCRRGNGCWNGLSTYQIQRDSPFLLSCSAQRQTACAITAVFEVCSTSASICNLCHDDS
jgi:hypothetical protein